LNIIPFIIIVACVGGIHVAWDFLKSIFLFIAAELKTLPELLEMMLPQLGLKEFAITLVVAIAIGALVMLLKGNVSKKERNRIFKNTGKAVDFISTVLQYASAKRDKRK